MRLIRLGRVAMQAEGLRMREQARRTARRAVFAAIALLMLSGALVFGHLALWYWLRESLPRAQAAGILAGGDLLGAILLGLMAARSAPGPAEQEARAVRERALDDATDSLAIPTLLIRLIETILAVRPKA